MGPERAWLEKICVIYYSEKYTVAKKKRRWETAWKECSTKNAVSIVRQKLEFVSKAKKCPGSKNNCSWIKKVETRVKKWSFFSSNRQSRGWRLRPFPVLLLCALNVPKKIRQCMGLVAVSIWTSLTPATSNVCNFLPFLRKLPFWSRNNYWTFQKIRQCMGLVAVSIWTSLIPATSNVCKI